MKTFEEAAADIVFAVGLDIWRHPQIRKRHSQTFEDTH